MHIAFVQHGFGPSLQPSHDCSEPHTTLLTTSVAEPSIALHRLPHMPHELKGKESLLVAHSPFLGASSPFLGASSLLPAKWPSRCYPTQCVLHHHPSSNIHHQHVELSCDHRVIFRTPQTLLPKFMSLKHWYWVLLLVRFSYICWFPWTDLAFKHSRILRDQ